MKKKYHILTADRHHLVPSIVSNIINDVPKFKHKFVLVGSNPKNKDVYLKMKGANPIDYILLQNIRELKPWNKEMRNNEVYLHGVPYSWMLYLILNRYKNINWICWGAGASTNFENYKSVLFHPFKKMIYKRFKKVGVLMPQDKTTLENHYGLKNIYSVAYSSGNKSYPYNLNKIYENNYNNNTVYIGNNSSSISSYLGAAKLLSNFKDINIVCMLNYNFKESAVSRTLMAYGKTAFGDRFRFDTDFYSRGDYYDYMDSCDIYICGIEKQTGLGAIHTTLKLGKKLYLTGKNFEWINSLGCKIFHIDELQNISEKEFIKSLSTDDKVMNYEIITHHFNAENNEKRWVEFFNGK